jgi:Uma2 family endonuclease
MQKFHLKLPEPMRWSDTELFEFCVANPQLRVEREANGNLILMAPTGGDTGINNSDLNADLVFWNRKTRLGYVFDSSTGFRLPSGAMRSPDVAWMVRDRYEALDPAERKKFPPLTPDFVIELRSETDSLAESKAKLEEWIENGARLGWLLDPQEHVAYVYRADGSVDTVAGDESFTLLGEDVLPGFELDF